jgi:hypothetical protein
MYDEWLLARIGHKIVYVLKTTHKKINSNQKENKTAMWQRKLLLVDEEIITLKLFLGGKSVRAFFI